MSKEVLWSQMKVLKGGANLTMEESLYRIIKRSILGCWYFASICHDANEPQHKSPQSESGQFFHEPLQVPSSYLNQADMHHQIINKGF
jgi:hypothetical protein